MRYHNLNPIFNIMSNPNYNPSPNPMSNPRTDPISNQCLTFCLSLLCWGLRAKHIGIFVKER